MPYKHNHSKSMAYHKPAGRHIPAMLAQYRQQSLKNRAGHHSKRQVNALPIQFALSAAQTVNAVDIRRLIGSQRTWQVIFLLLVIFPLLVQGIKAPDLHKNTIRLDDDQVPLLPADAVCQMKTVGISNGMICDIAGTTYYMKSVPKVVFDSNVVSSNGAAALLSYEEFNRQFVQNNIGARMPSATFFKTRRMMFFKNYYIATEKVEDLKFVDSKVNQDMKLGFRGVAKHAVATMFIHDVHLRNFGYDKDGLIIIDADSANIIPKSIEDYLDRAILGIKEYSLLLSVHHLRQMISIFEEMQKIPLPAYHDKFGLSHADYLKILETYVGLFKQVIDFLKLNRPDLKASQPDYYINVLLYQILLQEKLSMQAKRKNFPR